MVDAAQAARPHKVDGREVEPKRAVPREVSCFEILLQIVVIMCNGVVTLCIIHVKVHLQW